MLSALNCFPLFSYLFLLFYIFLLLYFSYVNIVLDHGTIFLKCLSFLGVKIFGKGASILTGLAEIVKKALKG